MNTSAGSQQPHPSVLPHVLLRKSKLCVKFVLLEKEAVGGSNERYFLISSARLLRLPELADYSRRMGEGALDFMDAIAKPGAGKEGKVGQEGVG